jgi:hypothetical protein
MKHVRTSATKPPPRRPVAALVQNRDGRYFGGTIDANAVSSPLSAQDAGVPVNVGESHTDLPAVVERDDPDDHMRRRARRDSIPVSEVHKLYFRIERLRAHRCFRRDAPMSGPKLVAYASIDALREALAQTESTVTVLHISTEARRLRVPEIESLVLAKLSKLSSGSVRMEFTPWAVDPVTGVRSRELRGA